jgi:hypothetical protein
VEEREDYHERSLRAIRDLICHEKIRHRNTKLSSHGKVHNALPVGEAPIDGTYSMYLPVLRFSSLSL